jgi:zinc transporter ZupT
MNAQSDQFPLKSENSKTDPLPTNRPIPGMGLAIGVFVGNLVFVSFLRSSISQGFLAGAAAAILVILIYQIVPGLRADEGNRTRRRS